MAVKTAKLSIQATYNNELQFFASDSLREYIPPKQGLRLHLCHSYRTLRCLREYIPPKQGLRLVCYGSDICYHGFESIFHQNKD